MSQKTDNMIKLALVFFVALLSFSIGTYVGKKYSDNQHKLSLLEPQQEKEAAPQAHGEEFATEGRDGKAAEATPAHSEASAEQKPAALTDSEVAKIAEEFATDEENTEEKAVSTIDSDEKEVKSITATPKAVPVKTIPVAATTGTLKPALDKVKNMAVTAEPTEERVPASIPTKKETVAAPVAMHFTVQIGSYPTVDEAEKITKDLQNKGYKTTYVPAKVNGQVWYRVNVGLFGSVKEAQDYKKEFLEKTKLSSAIVQRVQQ